MLALPFFLLLLAKTGQLAKGPSDIAFIIWFITVPFLAPWIYQLAIKVYKVKKRIYFVLFILTVLRLTL